MGKVSPKSSYKNMQKATKSTRFFVDKQATQVARAAKAPKPK